MTPSCPRASASSRKRCASAGSSVSRRGTTCLAASRESSAASRSRAGRSIRSSPSTCRQSKKNEASGRASPPRRSRRRSGSSSPGTGCGRPSSRSAIASPSRTIAETSSAATAATISGTRSVMSARLRVKIATSSPTRCTWIRAPSSFHSTYGVAQDARAAETSSAVCASIGPTGRSGLSRKRCETRGTVPHRDLGDRRKVAREHRRASYGCGRHRCSLRDRVGHDALERTLPQLAEEEPDEQALLGLGRAAEQRRELHLRAACEPGPEIACRRETAASTSRSSSVGRRCRKLAQGRPPDADRALRKLTREVRDSNCAPRRGRRRRGTRLSRATFASRDDVAATSRDVSATS